MEEFTTASNEKCVEFNLDEMKRCFDLLKDYHPIQAEIRKDIFVDKFEVIIRIMNFSTIQKAVDYINNNLGKR